MNITNYYKKGDTVLGVAKILFNQLRFEYPQVKIADICTTSSGGTPNRGNAEYYNGEIPWLKSGELNDNIITNVNEFITSDGLKNSSAKLFPKGTLLVAMYGATAGRTGFLNFESATNQAVCAMFPKDEININFLFWFLRQHRIDFILQSKGGAQPNISQTVIKKTLIPLPPIEVQLRIVSFLDKIYNKNILDTNLVSLSDFSKKQIEKYFMIRNTNEGLEEQISLQKNSLKKLKQSILQEAIQGKLTEEWRSDRKNQKPPLENASELLKRIKAEKAQLIKDKKIKKEKALPPIEEEEIPFELPEGWVWCRLGAVSINRDELRKPVSRKERVTRAKIFDYYGASGCIDKIDDYTHDGSYLLIGEDGSNLRLRASPIAFEVKGKFWVNNHAHTIQFVDSITQLYMKYHINGIDLKPYITGGFQPKLNQTNLNNILISLPPLEEQQEIVKKVEALMQHCEALEKEVVKSETNAQMLMQAVLKEAFEGEVKKEMV